MTSTEWRVVWLLTALMFITCLILAGLIHIEGQRYYDDIRSTERASIQATNSAIATEHSDS